MTNSSLHENWDAVRAAYVEPLTELPVPRYKHRLSPWEKPWNPKW